MYGGAGLFISLQTFLVLTYFKLILHNTLQWIPKGEWHQGALDELDWTKQILENKFSLFYETQLTHAALPFPACMERDTQQQTPNLNETKDCMTLWPFAVYETCYIDSGFTNRSHAAFPFSCMQRKGHPTLDSKSEWHQGVYDPGAFKMDQ